MHTHTRIQIHIAYRPSLYVTENTVCFHYKEQSASAVQRCNRCWLSAPYGQCVVSVHSLCFKPGGVHEYSNHWTFSNWIFYASCDRHCHERKVKVPGDQPRRFSGQHLDPDYTEVDPPRYGRPSYNAGITMAPQITPRWTKTWWFMRGQVKAAAWSLLPAVRLAHTRMAITMMNRTRKVTDLHGYSMSTLSAEEKRPRCDAHLPRTSSAEAKKMWSHFLHSPILLHVLHNHIFTAL